MENITETEATDTTGAAFAAAQKSKLRLAGRPFLMVNVLQRPKTIRPFHTRRVEIGSGRVLGEETRDDEGKVLKEAEVATKPVRIVRIKGNAVNVTPTHQRGWHEVPGNMVSFEQPSIVDRVKDRHLSDTNIIIDVLRGELVKSNIRTQENVADDQIVEHYLSKYMDICKQGIDKYLVKMANTHLMNNTVDELKARVAEAAPEADLI